MYRCAHWIGVWKGSRVGLEVMVNRGMLPTVGIKPQHRNELAKDTNDSFYRMVIFNTDVVRDALAYMPIYRPIHQGK
jgi:hypothetical protein